MKTRSRQLALILALLLVSTQMRSGNNNRSGLHAQACPNVHISSDQAENGIEEEIDQALMTEYRIGNLMSII